jgi:alanine dehydrogenase
MKLPRDGRGARGRCSGPQPDASLALGVNTHAGHLVNAAVGEATGFAAVPLADALAA